MALPFIFTIVTVCLHFFLEILQLRVPGNNTYFRFRF